MKRHLGSKIIIFSLLVCFTFPGYAQAVSKNNSNADKDSTAASTDGSFTIAIIPDTQYYLSGYRNGEYEMFTTQIDWIKKNAARHNIKYAAHLGDITDLGDSVMTQWEQAAKAMYALETPMPGYPHGIPYGLSVGNHDQYAPSHKYGSPFTCNTYGYNKYFGIRHFASKSYKNGGYYGGHFGSNNDCHYDLFDAGGQGYIVVYIEYDNSNPHEDLSGLMTNWASDILSKYSNRKAIIVSHSILKPGPNPSYNDRFASFSPQGQRIYDAVKHHKNVFLMLCGHEGRHGEGYREDVFNGNIIRSYLSNYQMRPTGSKPKEGDGGGGLMRILKFWPKQDRMEVITFTPYKNPIEYETDGDSQFTRPMFFNETHSRKLDFAQEGKTNLALFNRGTWKVSELSDVQLGKADDIPVPADYNGDGKTEYAFWRPKTGEWIIKKDGAGTRPPVILGMRNNIPVPADYDGNGKADMAVYDPGNGKWSVNYQLAGKVSTAEQILGGRPGDIPVPADYNGDGKVDYAIFRKTANEWLIHNYAQLNFGEPGDIPVPGDYDGDGKTDITVYRPSSNSWITAAVQSPIAAPADYTEKSVVFGAEDAVPAPGDYNGDGKTDRAYYLHRTHTLYMEGGQTIVLGNRSDELLNLPYAVRKIFFP